MTWGDLRAMAQWISFTRVPMVGISPVRLDILVHRVARSAFSGSKCPSTIANTCAMCFVRDVSTARSVSVITIWGRSVWAWAMEAIAASCAVNLELSLREPAKSSKRKMAPTTPRIDYPAPCIRRMNAGDGGAAGAVALATSVEKTQKKGVQDQNLEQLRVASASTPPPK